MKVVLTVVAIFAAFVASRACSAQEQMPLKVCTFDLDVTPPVGSMMAYDPVLRKDDLSLRCRGVVLLGAGRPIVLCAVDWIGIANEAHDAFRQALADGAGTDRSRVALHTLHQHDAPAADFSAERLLKEAGAGAGKLGRYDGQFARQVIEQAKQAVQASLALAKTVTHVGWGAADVHDVASSRRILGPDGKVRVVRFSAAKEAVVRNEPVGTIDPRVVVISFWNDQQPLAVLSYYACHPQSYYRTGIPNPDFPGIARFIRGQAVPEALHVHFNGAGGNVAAGKYNDGAKENRVQLALRLADGMQRAWSATKKKPISAQDVGWKVVPVALPPAAHLDEPSLRASLRIESESLAAADKLAWLERCLNGHKIELSMLRLGDIRVLHMPSELFVEYQLAAQQMRPDLHVAMAAYGEYGPGYIGTEIAYGEGGYETSAGASDVAPSVDAILMDGMRELLVEK